MRIICECELTENTHIFIFTKECENDVTMCSECGNDLADKMREDGWKRDDDDDEDDYDDDNDLFVTLLAAATQKPEDEDIICEECKTNINILEDGYNYDDDTGFYQCENCCEDEEEEQQEECCGKHCDETKNLTKAMGWNRYHFSKEDMITEQLFCENCIEEYTTEKCKSCGEIYKYTEMKYRYGGNFGEGLYGHDDFFCVPCIKYINEVDVGEK
jgi:hypothetical protein